MGCIDKSSFIGAKDEVTVIGGTVLESAEV
jgi:hypothetical protein